MSSDTETSDENNSDEDINDGLVMECETDDNDDEQQNSNNDLGLFPYRFEPELDSGNSENSSFSDSNDEEINPDNQDAW
jgi:hypothetical protein